MSEWISVKDIKPRINKTILLTDGCTVFPGFRHGRGKYDYSILYADERELKKLNYVSGYLKLFLTHWMPLPSPPEEGKND